MNALDLDIKNLRIGSVYRLVGTPIIRQLGAESFEGSSIKSPGRYKIVHTMSNIQLAVLANASVYVKYNGGSLTTSWVKYVLNIDIVYPVWQEWWRYFDYRAYEYMVTLQDPIYKSRNLPKMMRSLDVDVSSLCDSLELVDISVESPEVVIQVAGEYF